MYRENQIRTLIKTLTWRVIATLTTMILVYIFYRDFTIAGAIGMIEVVAKLIVYYIHERLWDRVRYGKTKPKSFVLWFTGLSGSGKSTLAERLYEYLEAHKFNVEMLDGDVIREIFPKTGFSKEDRNSHVKRVGYFASILEKNGVIPITSLISPYKEARNFVRDKCTNFIEIYVSTPLEECEKRDVKGLYKKVRDGEIKNFTGVDDPYEAPENPEIEIDTSKYSIEESVEYIVSHLKHKYL